MGCYKASYETFAYTYFLDFWKTLSFQEQNKVIEYLVKLSFYVSFMIVYVNDGMFYHETFSIFI